MKKETELQHLRKAVDCLGEQLDAKQLNRLHRAMMFKGPAHTALMDIVEGGYEQAKVLEILKDDFSLNKTGLFGQNQS